MQEMFCMLVNIERCEEQHSTKWNPFLKLPIAFTPLTCIQAGLVPIKVRNPLGARTGWILLSREGFWIGFITRVSARADQSRPSRSVARLRSETAQRAIPEAGPDRGPHAESGRTERKILRAQEFAQAVDDEGQPLLSPAGFPPRRNHL